MTIYCAINPNTTEKIGKDHPRKWWYNNSFENREFDTLRDLMIQVYRGHPYCAQHHHINQPYVKRDGTEGKTAFRHSKNFWRCNVVSIDFDGETEACSIPSLMMDPLIMVHGGALYSTVSSRPEAPRTRVVFETEEVIEDPDYYRALNESLFYSYRMADQGAKDACRIFAGSLNCEVCMVGGRLRKAHCDALVASYVRYEMEKLQKTQERRRDALEHGGEDIKTTQEALKYLDGETLSYPDYLKILSAIWSQFPGPDGEALAEDWAGERRKSEVSYKWQNGFNGSITILTLFWMARQNGWPGALSFDSDEDRADYFTRKILSRYQ